MLKHEVRLNDYWYVMRNLNYSKIQGKILVNYDMVNLDYLGNSFSNLLNCRIINCKGLVYNQQQREEVLPISNKPRSKIRIERDLIKAKNAIRILGLNFNHSFHTTWCVRPRHFPLVSFTTLRNKFSLHLSSLLSCSHDTSGQPNQCTISCVSHLQSFLSLTQINTSKHHIYTDCKTRESEK